jgi:transcriptional regulator GlxA family with amidase domain
MVSTEAGPVTLHPALKINAAKTTAEFEATWPDGPDYVIVPAYHDPKAPKAIEWMQLMSRRGSTIVSVCAGGLTVGHAGLFEGRQATTHWFSVDELKKISPGMIWRKDRRYVADRGVVSTTGVSASIPVSLALVEAIAGRSKADALAVELGVSKFDEAHDSNAFRKADGFLGRGVVNSANLLGQETYALRISDGVDELTLAVTADAWSRTYRSTCLTIGSAATVRSLHGLDLIVDRGSEDKHLHALEALPAKPGEGINSALAAIAKRYGVPTASFVALQLEYPWLAGKVV